MSEITLTDWLRDDDNLPNKRSASALAQHEDVRFAVRVMFAYWSDLQKSLLVAGTHRSKSITLPVYHIDLSVLHGVHVWMRGNFYDWKVSVKSDRPVVGVDFLDVFDPTVEHLDCYCEGMDQVFGSYSANPSEFTVSIGSVFDLAVFFRVLRRFVLAPR